MTFTKKIATAQAVGQGSAFTVKGALRWSFFVKRTAGADRAIKIFGTLMDPATATVLTDYFDLGLTFVFDGNNNAYLKFEGILNSVVVDVSGGATGTYDVTMAASDS